MSFAVEVRALVWRGQELLCAPEGDAWTLPGAALAGRQSLRQTLLEALEHQLGWTPSGSGHLRAVGRLDDQSMVVLLEFPRDSDEAPGEGAWRSSRQLQQLVGEERFSPALAGLIRWPEAKLVRDRIPDLIAARGESAAVRRLSPEELLPALATKLREEAEEVVQAANAEQLLAELADCLEVLDALREQAGISEEELQQAQRSKRDARGGFAEGWVLGD